MRIPIQLIVSLLILCTACQMGRIPCPKIKTVKLHKNYRPSAALLSAKANQEQETANKTKEGRPNDVHFIKNISVEEWDCPKPGAKRYMPKSVKENIRKNKKKFESDLRKETQADSLSSR